MLECIVTKFGGSSLANDEQFRTVRSILELEPTRRYLVPSAPGKRFGEDDKVTDLLYACYNLASEGRPFAEPFARKIEGTDRDEDRQSGGEHQVPVGEGIGERLTQQFSPARCRILHPETEKT